MAKKGKDNQGNRAKGATKSKDGVNKSQLIRDAFAKGITKPTAVVAHLAEQGVTVTPQMVSQVKTNAKKKGRKGKRGRPAGATTTRATTKTSGDVIGAVLNLAKLARQHTVAKLRQWLDRLED